MIDEHATDAKALVESVDDPERFGVVVRRWSQPLLRYFYRRTFDDFPFVEPDDVQPILKYAAALSGSA